MVEEAAPCTALALFDPAFDTQYDESLHNVKLASDLPSNILAPISSVPCVIPSIWPAILAHRGHGSR